jgi:peptide-methionine (S)-S-oxide reductase
MSTTSFSAPSNNRAAESNSRNSSNSISLTTALFAVAVAFFLMASAMPSFLQRLIRPMSTAMGITGAAGGGSARHNVPEGAEKATVGAGCFWGVEHLYRKHFGDKGLYDARVGYTGGDATNPSYKQVCSGKTGRKFILSTLAS